MTTLILPDELKSGNYPALLILVFPLVGLALLVNAIKKHRTYKRFGATPLTLDPKAPGIGGELGGSIVIPGLALSQSIRTVPELQATLTCAEITKHKDNKTTKQLWSTKVPVHTEQAMEGLSATFLFDVPDNYPPSQAWQNNHEFRWTVSIKGDCSELGLGEFSRQWVVEVSDTPTESSQFLDVPSDYKQSNNRDALKRTTKSAELQFPIVDQGQSIHLYSKPRRDVFASWIAVFVNIIFFLIGAVFAYEGMIFGYIFSVISVLVVATILFVMGKTIDVTIDRSTQAIRSTTQWFGINIGSFTGIIKSPDQLKVENTSTTTSAAESTSYYAIEFKSDEGSTRIAHGLEGRHESEVIRKTIIEKIFPDSDNQKAA